MGRFVGCPVGCLVGCPVGNLVGDDDDGTNVGGFVAPTAVGTADGEAVGML